MEQCGIHSSGICTSFLNPPQLTVKLRPLEEKLELARISNARETVFMEKWETGTKIIGTPKIFHELHSAVCFNQYIIYIRATTSSRKSQMYVLKRTI